MTNILEMIAIAGAVQISVLGAATALAVKILKEKMGLTKPSANAAPFDQSLFPVPPDSDNPYGGFDHGIH
jgi:hypothetical protein